MENTDQEIVAEDEQVMVEEETEQVLSQPPS
jgi:hypothetical protein